MALRDSEGNIYKMSALLLPSVDSCMGGKMENIRRHFWA